MNKSFISEEINNELLKFTDTVPYTNSDVNIDLINKIKKEYNLILYSDEPIKAGMISLVFQLHDENAGKDIILKMKRVNIDEKLRIAIENFQFFINVLSYIPYLNVLDIRTLLNKNISILKEQLNFHEEVNNTIEYADKCRNIKYLKIPQIYKEVTDKYGDAIMMEFINGKSINEIDEGDHKIYSSLLMKSALVSIMLNGLAHGDLHPGNILFIKNEKGSIDLPEYQIAFIDFGIVLRIDEHIRTYMLNLASDALLSTKSIKEIAKDLLFLYTEPAELLNTLPEIHINTILSTIEKILHSSFCVEGGANISNLFNIVVELNSYMYNNDLYKYGISQNESFVKTQLAAVMCNAVNMVLCKNDIMPVLNQTLNEMFHTDLLRDD